MFNSISFLHQNKYNPATPIDIGALIECMLFYQKTTVIADSLIMAQLLRYFGADRLCFLLQERFLKIIYTETYVGIITRNRNNTEFHDTVQVSSPQHTFHHELQKTCIDVIGKEGKGRRLARRLQNYVDIVPHDPLILTSARASILDQNYIAMAVPVIIKDLIPELHEIPDLVFRTEKTDEGIAIATNIDYSKLNSLYHKKVSPTHSTFTAAFILSQILNVEKELYFSSSNLSELASSNLSAQLAQIKIDYIIDRSLKSRQTLDRFTKLIFPNAKSIREAANAGQIDLDELLKVLEKSKKFKQWVVELNPDADLIKDYFDAVTKETALDKLPCKSLRWAIFTGIGLACDAAGAGGYGTAAGVALSALDTFCLEKIISGWKPNHFIDEHLSKLI